MMETLCSTSDLASESGLPCTPPYTPARNTKQRLERSHSPASVAGSIHPIDTDSPAKEAAKQITLDDVRVQELVEGDLGYITDTGVVYPEELEEATSVSSDDEDSNASDLSDTEAAGLSRRLSRMRCGDDRELDFEQYRRRTHQEKRSSVLSIKRPHSQTIKGEQDEEPDNSDAIAPDDHDHPKTGRRLRRRTHGPSQPGMNLAELWKSSAEFGRIRADTESHASESVKYVLAGDAMEMDEED